MGNFKIVIEAVGNHGVDREKRDGEDVNFAEGGLDTADAMAKKLVDDLVIRGFSVDKAQIIHWPDEDGNVTHSSAVDDLRNSKRIKDFY